MTCDPVQIAVLGSCATRDSFSTRFNPGYEAFVDCVLTPNQSSLVSLTAKAMQVSPAELGPDLSDDDRRCVTTDFTKEFLPQLREARPAYLVVDFFSDVHLGYVDLGDGRRITNDRWRLSKTPYYRDLVAGGRLRVVEVDRDPETYLDAWADSVDLLLDFVHQEVPGCEVLVHKVRNTDGYLDPQGLDQRLSASGRVKPVDTAVLDEAWDVMDAYVEKRHRLRALVSGTSGGTGAEPLAPELRRTA